MLHFMSLRLFLVFLVTLNTVQAWGAFGHSLMGSVVMHFLSHHAKEKLKQLFRDEQGQLNIISTWADQIKHQTKYEGTSELHYSNAHDNPPFQCSFLYHRDCENGTCVVSAIREFSTAVHNYTVRHSELLPRMYPPPLINPILFLQPHFKFTLSDTIKFLVHFVQDIHQPLHVTGRDRGGNDTPVLFDGEKTHLHFVWDVLLLEKFFKDSFRENEEKLVKHIIKILTQEQSSIASWLQCPSSIYPVFPGNKHEELVLSDVKAEHTDKFTPRLNAMLCPEIWANAINQLNCEHVWKFDANEDLGGEYYTKNIHILLKSIAIGCRETASKGPQGPTGYSILE